jgi:hypothetical protein
MILKVSEDVKRKYLSFGSIKKVVRPGMKFTVSDKDIYNQDIQNALRNGVLIIEQNEDNKVVLNEQCTEITNVSSRDVILGSVILGPGKSLLVNEEQLNDRYMQNAILNRKIKCSDSNLSKTMDIPNEVKKVAESKIGKTNMKSWDAHNQKVLNKEESQKKAVVEMTSREEVEDTSDEVQSGEDIDFDKVAIKTKKTKKTAKKTSNQTLQKKTASTTRKTLKPVGIVKDPNLQPPISIADARPKVDMDAIENNLKYGVFIEETHAPSDMSFVDREQIISKANEAGIILDLDSTDDSFIDI